MTDRNSEQQRLWDLYDMQMELHKEGYQLIAGVDEAGRGPLAGPVVAATVVLEPYTMIEGLKDSKQLSEKKREALYSEIIDKALAWAYDIVDREYIDENNILKATELAMTRAVNKLNPKPDFVLVDAVKLPMLKTPQRGVVRGDKLCACIAAASIIAKVTRDRIMRNYDALYPEYGFKSHKGYGTKAHIEAIKKFGFSPIHRRSFSIKGLEV